MSMQRTYFHLEDSENDDTFNLVFIICRDLRVQDFWTSPSPSPSPGLDSRVRVRVRVQRRREHFPDSSKSPEFFGHYLRRKGHVSMLKNDVSKMIQGIPFPPIFRL